jgi:hypothetical protein
MLATKERPMKYMLMLYADEKTGAAIPPEQMAKAMDILGAYQAALTKAGAFVATNALAPTWDAKTIRMEGGEVARDGTFSNQGGELRVHDGPYAETREQLGGYYIIDVADMDEAIKWASRCPAAQWGSIEVRPYHPGYAP